MRASGQRLCVEKRVSTTADVRVESLTLELTDGAGALLGTPSNMLSRLGLLQGGVPIVADPRPEQGFFQRSDNIAFDLDGDGLADTPYRPNDLVDQIVWRHPLAKLLLNSPATQLLRWAQSAFPALYPGGVTDSHPLMAPDLEG